MIFYKRDSFKNIVSLSFPVIFGQIMFTILHFSDRFFISKLGINEAAGSSLSGGLVWVMFSVIALVSGGTIALISRKVGENNTKEASSAAEQSILLAFIISLSLTIITFYFSENIFAFYGAEQIVEDIGLSYFGIIVFGFPMMMTASVVGAAFQAAGNTKTPMKVFTFMSIFNLILDPILIFGIGPIPSLGVDGAALATVIAESFAFIYILKKLSTFKKLNINKYLSFRPDFDMMKRILRIGMWAGLNSLSRPLSAIFLQKVITFHGTNCIAAFSFGIQWISILFIFQDGLRVAVSTLVGQNLGKKDLDEVYDTVKSGIIFGAIVMSFFTILGLIYADIAISIFSLNEEIIKYGASYLRIVLYGILFVVPITVYGAVFNGSGDTMPPTVISFLSNWGGKIVFAYVASYYLGYGINSVWLAITISIVLEGLGMTIWYKRGGWIKKKV